MYRLWKEGRGGVLGDDMGLGSILLLSQRIANRCVETVQVIAFLTAIFGKRGTSTDKKRMRLARERNLAYPRILIICPGSVMSNWERELHTVHISLATLTHESGDGGTYPYSTEQIK